MRIPTGNFGHTIAQPATPVSRQPVYEAAGRAALLGFQGEVAERERQTEERQQLARAKGATALLEHQVETEGVTASIADRVNTGELDYSKARATYDEEVGKIKRPSIPDIDAVGLEGLTRGLEVNHRRGAIALDRVVNAARIKDHQAQFTQSLDALGKLAGMPGADINAINQKAGQVGEIGRQSGLDADDVSKALQNFKDQNWLNDATQRAMGARNNMGALKVLADDLTKKDGYYAGKLDTNKRNAVLRSVQSDQDRLNAKVLFAADRREARAVRSMNEIERQIASGVPATAEMWSGWASDVAGTEQAEPFKETLEQEDQVQQLLRQPIDTQVKFVQDKEAALLEGGGSLREAANVNRLKGAVTKNVNLLQQNPLLFNSNRLGTELRPIDPAMLLDEGSHEQVANTLRERAITLRTMSKQYGTQVPLKPLLPQEAAALGSVLNEATPKTAASLFSQLRQVFDSDDIYRGAMQQIAPDSPVRSLAGQIASRQTSLTLERNWIGDDVMASSQDVAATILEGESLLNATKKQKAEGGKEKLSLYLPEENSLQQRFQQVVGTAFAGRPGAADVAFQTVKAYYVGKAARVGKIASDKSDIDSNLVREAVKATVGEVIDYNGKGDVLAPWGMSESVFKDQVEGQLKAAAKERGVEPDSPAIFAVGLVGTKESGTYYVTTGRSYLHDSKGNPVKIRVQDPAQ